MTTFPLFVTVISLTFALPHAAAAETATLTVTEDSWIDGLGSSSPQGAGTDLRICPVADYWIYLKFDLSSVSGIVTDVALRMNRFGGSRPEEISVYRVTDDSWGEATLTGANRPAPVSPPNASALGTGLAAGPYDTWSSQALTDVIAQEASGDGILTLMVRENPSSTLDVRNYYSKESPRPDDEKPRLVVSTVDELIDPGWLVADVASGTKPSFDFDAGGRIHIMAMTEMPGGEVWHADADAMFGPWSPRVVTNGYVYGPGDIRVDTNGTAHLAWHNHNLPGPSYAAVPADGPIRILDIVNPGLHDGWDNALAFAPDGTLHQSSIYPSNFGAANGLQYGSFDGTAWTYETSIAGSGLVMYGLATSLAMDKNGNPHIAYCGSTGWTDPGDLMYATKANGIWTFSAVVNGGIRGRFPSIALDHWDRPHISWIDIDAGDHTRGTVRYAVLNSETWEIEDVDTLTDIKLGFGDARKSTSLVLDNNWRPHVAYADEQVIKYAQKPFDTWNHTTVLTHAAPDIKGLVVLRLDGDSRPGIVFWQDDPSSPGLVRLARPRQSAYVIKNISLTGGAGPIALDWSPGFDGHEYTVQISESTSGAWTNAPGAWPTSSTTWTQSGAVASQQVYRVLASRP